MLTKMLGEIKEVAPYVTSAEALVKLVIVADRCSPIDKRSIVIYTIN